MAVRGTSEGHPNIHFQTIAVGSWGRWVHRGGCFWYFTIRRALLFPNECQYADLIHTDKSHLHCRLLLQPYCPSHINKALVSVHALLNWSLYQCISLMGDVWITCQCVPFSRMPPMQEFDVGIWSGAWILGFTLWLFYGMLLRAFSRYSSFLPSFINVCLLVA